MSRLIDADALIKRLAYCVKQGMGATIAYTFMHMIDDEHTVDAVSVVRCKECKYWRAYETWSECVLWAGDPYESAKTNADDYCSHGERKESE